MELRITWIRHGMTKSNEEFRYLGKTDEELSEAGICDLQRIRSVLSEYPESNATDLYLVASPMKRCIQTAELLYGRQPDLLISQWEEIDFGLFERKNYMELQGNPLYQEWIDSNGTMPFPNGESREAFIERCKDGLRYLIDTIQVKENDGRNKTDIIAVVHGGTIMAILSSLTGQEYFDFQVKNGIQYKTVCSCEEGIVTLSKIEEIVI